MASTMASTVDKILEVAQSAPERWHGSFAEYLEMVIANPKVARSAHALLRDAVYAKGVSVETDSTGREIRKFGVFDEIYGIESALDQIMRVVESAALGQDTRRRILFLAGPPASAKSTIVYLLKRALEEYSRTPEGAIYGIEGCPLHEEPLHLLPEEARRRLREETGIEVEGELCPVCLYRLDNEWHGDIASVPVERIFIDEQRRVGIATFCPSDPNVQDVSDLVGSMDLVALQKFGVESHPLAFAFDGALDVANRGLCELVELWKNRGEMLYVLLTVAQERQIKTGRFALISADEVLVAHSNYAELEAFSSDKKNEAILDRVIRVDVPYNIRWSDEEKIYDKMTRGRPWHAAPWTFRVAAAVAILSRFQPHEKYPPITRLRLYDGLLGGRYTVWHVDEARQLCPNDGRMGVSPRQVIAALNQAAVGKECLTPIDALRALRDSHQHHLSSISKGALDALVADARKEYDTWIVRSVSQAFVDSFSDVAQGLFQKYLDHAEAVLGKEKVKDPITGEWKDPDEKFLRSIEEVLDISPSSATAFREEIVRKAGTAARRGQPMRWDSHERMKEGIEKRLFADLQGTIRTTISGYAPDEEQRRRLEGVKRHMIEHLGFCPICADEALKYVGELLAR
jgi:serine protein kinase